MITLQDFSLRLEDWLKPERFVDYAPNGLQVEGRSVVRKIACSVSASLAVIEKAVELRADALIVHHGLFWNRDPLPICGTKQLKLKKLLENEISLFGFHLPLDAHPDLGNNWRAAKEMGWEQLEPFEGIGVRGRFSSRSIQTFQAELEKYYGQPAHVALGGAQVISSAALISGGAHKEIGKAADLGVDCYITGSFDEPVWDIAHERKIHFFALGHHATERIGIRALGQYIEQVLNIPCSFIDTNNPF